MSVVLDPSEVVRALERTGRVFVCIVLDVDVPASGATVSVKAPPILVVTNVKQASQQSNLLRQSADWVDEQERKLHRAKANNTSN